MFAIAFDLVVDETRKRQPKGVANAYYDIGATLERFGFSNVQGGVYVCEREDLANLFAAINQGSDPSLAPSRFLLSGRS